MRAGLECLGRLRALCATLLLAFALAAAPAVEATKHGPGALAAEADHRAQLAEHGHAHELPGPHHDPEEHDHVAAALPAPPGCVSHLLPHGLLRPDGIAVGGTIRDGPRRPPRLAAS